MVMVTKTTRCTALYLGTSILSTEEDVNLWPISLQRKSGTSTNFSFQNWLEFFDNLNQFRGASIIVQNHLIRGQTMVSFYPVFSSIAAGIPTQPYL